MKRNHSDLVRVSDAAAAWLLRLEDDDSPQTRAEFDKWLRQGGPAYYEEFLLAQMQWNVLDHLDSSLNLKRPEANESVVEFPARQRASASETLSPRSGDGPGEEHPIERVAADPAGEETRASASAECSPSPSHREGAARLRKREGRRSRWRIRVAASVLLAVCALVLYSSWPLGSQVYATAVGGQQSIKLADGSIIQLNTHSRVRVHYSEHLREIRLLDGEVLFTVAHDTARPFIVITESARVRAVGTQFNVYRNGIDATRVSVLDGVVQVTTVDPHTAASRPPSPAAGEGRGEEIPRSEETRGASTERAPSPRSGEGRGEVLRLAAGDEAVVAGGKVQKATVPDVRRAVAWQQRLLVFAGDRLDYIADQFNRYNDLKIRVEGSVAERRMGGTFDVDNPMPMVRYLSRDPQIEVIKGDTEIVIRPREASGSMR